VGQQRGAVDEGRMVHDPYRLRDFVKLSRDHGAHFWEDITKAHTERLDFQKAVLGYDQQSDGTHINHSVALLDKLGWHSYKDVEADLIKLFDPTDIWNPTWGWLGNRGQIPDPNRVKSVQHQSLRPVNRLVQFLDSLSKIRSLQREALSVQNSPQEFRCNAEDCCLNENTAD
jgi:hypothetical protein